MTIPRLAAASRPGIPFFLHNLVRFFSMIISFVGTIPREEETLKISIAPTLSANIIMCRWNILWLRPFTVPA
jgi:hypothetical protein